jgi:xylan 1,4-beta-xylosidase
MTYANPVDLPYRYQRSTTPYREAADPTVVFFKGRYWLFPSHSSGYFHSTDLLHWTFIQPKGYSVNTFAPTVMAMNGKLYIAVSENAPRLWVTDDPMSGQWSIAAKISPGYNDPCLFLDDDGKVYMYEGLSATQSQRVVELDPTTLQPLREAEIPQDRDKANRGWEVVGDHNEAEGQPTYIEGAWVNKVKGKYYFQYAAPGTEYKTYADGLLVADNPMGPFTYQSISPFSVKPTGFIAGAGHSSTFETPEGKWWHISTLTISKRHAFERRLGLYPTVFTQEGPVADTYLGDYPHYIDGDRGLTGWMLLSRKAVATASSTLGTFEAANAADEDVRTWWSAQTGNPGEWFELDLGAVKRIDALQINFADQDSAGVGISTEVYKYVLELSVDGKSWKAAVDTTLGGRDAPHDYQVLDKPAKARFVRLRNVHTPDGGKFSLYDLRVFGKGGVAVAQATQNVQGVRDKADARKATISWQKATGAQFYVVRFGAKPDAMNQNYQVYDGATSLAVASLNAGVKYYVTVDAINEAGITVNHKIAIIQ